MDPCKAKAASARLLAELRSGLQPPAKLPKPQITPGVVNPNVRQGTIKQTICHPGWADRKRPPTRYTSETKLKQMKQYGEKGPQSDYEEDYLFPSQPRRGRTQSQEPLARAPSTNAPVEPP